MELNEVGRQSETSVGLRQMMMTHLSLEQVPARFAICEETESSEDSRVLGWGLAFDDEAVVVPTNGGLPNPFSGIKGALRLYGKLRDVRLVWVDPPDGRELT